MNLSALPPQLIGRRSQALFELARAYDPSVRTAREGCSPNTG